jgi:hypothetical protein
MIKRFQIPGTLLALLAFTVIALPSCGPGFQTNEKLNAETIIFTAELQQIVNEYCAYCHYPGGSNYIVTPERALRLDAPIKTPLKLPRHVAQKVIKEVVITKTMPPTNPNQIRRYSWIGHLEAYNAQNPGSPAGWSHPCGYQAFDGTVNRQASYDNYPIMYPYPQSQLPQLGGGGSQGGLAQPCTTIMPQGAMSDELFLLQKVIEPPFGLPLDATVFEEFRKFGLEWGLLDADTNGI